MSDRAERLADRLEQKVGEVMEMSAAVTDEQLRLRCADPKGSTVGAVLSHLREGTDDVLAWAARFHDSGGTAAPAAHLHDHDHGHVHDDDDHEHDHEHDHDHVPDAAEQAGTVAALGRARSVLGGTVRGLSDEQLDYVPPATKDVTDGSLTLEGIVVAIVEDLDKHMAYVAAAVGALAGSRPDA